MNQCWFKKCLVFVPIGDIRPEFRALKHVEAQGKILRDSVSRVFRSQQLWIPTVWGKITDRKLVSVFGFLYLKNTIHSKTQLIDFLGGLNLLKYMKCWEQWLTHSKRYVNVYYKALNPTLWIFLNVLWLISLYLDLYLT